MRGWMIGIALWAAALALAFTVDTWCYDTAARGVAEATGMKTERFGLTEWGRASLLKETLELFKRMGHGLFALFVSVTMVVLGRNRLRHAGIFWLCFLAAGGVGELARHSISKVRPDVELTSAELAAVGVDNAVRLDKPRGPVYINRGHALFRRPFTGGSPYGLPSGHAAVAFAMFAALARFYPRGTWWFLFLAVGVALSRVLMGAHFLSDVVAGAGLGFATARGVLALTLRK